MFVSCTYYKNNWLNTIAAIIGTGTNHAFAADNQIINLESAGFNKFTPTDSGRIVDQQSKNIGRAIIEKEIAGAYLYRHFNIVAKENNLNVLLQSTKELSLLAEKNDSDASGLAQILLERSASFAACQIAGIVEFLTNYSVISNPSLSSRTDQQIGINSVRDLASETSAKKHASLDFSVTPRNDINTNLTFVMEGALFWEGYKYKSFLEKYLQTLGVNVRATHESPTLSFNPERHHSIKGGIKLLTGLS